MDIAGVQKFVAENHRGVLVARKRDGWPQLTRVCSMGVAVSIASWAGESSEAHPSTDRSAEKRL
jgi:hypothetical protein